jgi:hypothetical protein
MTIAPVRHALQDQRVTSTLDHVDELLRFPDVHPYTKFWGTHWRLVELADLDTPIPPGRLQAGVDQEVAWLSSSVSHPPSRSGDRLPRRHASMEGNAVYAFSRLGFAHHPSTRRLAEALIEWQWPDGGWNCDRHRTAHRSSFHESVTPALGLASYAHQTGEAAALAARRPDRGAAAATPAVPGSWHRGANPSVMDEASLPAVLALRRAPGSAAAPRG